MKGRQKIKVEWSKFSLEDRRLIDRPGDFKIYKIHGCLRDSGVVATATSGSGEEGTVPTTDRARRHR